MTVHTFDILPVVYHEIRPQSYFLRSLVREFILSWSYPGLDLRRFVSFTQQDLGIIKRDKRHPS